MISEFMEQLSSSEINRYSYDPHDVSVFRTYLLDKVSAIKFYSGLAISVVVFFLSIGIYYIYVFPILFFSVYMFFDVLSGIKELTMDDSLKGRLDFKPFGDEKQVSNYFYTAFLISNLLVYLFNLEFSKRPQLLDIYGFYFTQALHMLFLLTLFMSLRKILSTHEIVLIHSPLPESPQSSQSTQDPTDNGIKKVILLGFNEKKAKLLMLFILAVFGTYLVFIVLGIVLFEYSVDNSYQIPLFIGIEVKIGAYLTTFRMDILCLVFQFVVFGCFIFFMVVFYRSLSVIASRVPVISEKIDHEIMEEKIMIRGLDLLLEGVEELSNNKKRN